MSTKRRIYCKLCDNFYYKIDDLVSHVEKKHIDLIPQDMTAWQFVYYWKTNKDHGNCIICKQNTTWNEKTHKYNRFCENESCKQKYINTFKKRMINKYGKTTLLNDPEQQKLMLSKRKISGIYHWSDRIHTSVYTGTYELDFLKFLDNVMQFDPEDVMSPSPHTYYYIYENKKHFYIPDFFIPSLNLEIEIKEGTNNHPKIQQVDKVKEKLKDEVMMGNKTFNYIKIVEKDNMRFLKFLEIAKDNFANNIDKPIFII